MPKSKEYLLRHIKLPGFGEKKQAELSKKTVALVGLGGIGTPIAVYLVCAGIGRLIIIDKDVVEKSNLNRQFAYSLQDVGKPKAECMAAFLKRLSTTTEIIAYRAELDEHNIDDLTAEADLIVEGVDNFETRFLINRYCVDNRIPYVHAAIQGTQGQLFIVKIPETPCLRCAFGDLKPLPGIEPPPVFGPATGVLGSLAAVEVIKLLTGYGKCILNKLLIVDIYDASFIAIDVKKDPECPVCSMYQHDTG